MSYAGVAQGLILAGLSAYLLFGGADFGAGIWHAVLRGHRERAVIEHAMGPLWEANHVWLIFAMALTWTAFPPVFADIAGRFWVPLSLAALGIVARGSALAFRKVVPDRFAPTFALASLVTPFCLGSVAGAVATGTSGWLAFGPMYVGLLTVGLCAYLAAVYLTWDAGRLSGAALASRLRRCALGTGAVVGALALPGAVVSGVRSPLIMLSVGGGLVSLILLWRRRYLAVRLTAALATGAVLWGAAALHRLDLAPAAAPAPVIEVVVIAVGIGGVLLLPSLVWLYVLFQRAK